MFQWRLLLGFDFRVVLFIRPKTQTSTYRKASNGNSRTKRSAKRPDGSSENEWRCEFVFFCIRIHNKCVV